MKFVTLRTSRKNWGKLKCPTARQECINVFEGLKFIVEKETTLKAIIRTRTEYWLQMDIILGLEFIDLPNRIEYLAVTSTLKNTPTNLLNIARVYTAAQTESKNKKDRATQSATALGGPALVDLDEAFSEIIQSLKRGNLDAFLLS